MSKTPTGIRQWIWRVIVQTALIPLVLVEGVLVATYLLTNSAIRDAQIDSLREAALSDAERQGICDWTKAEIARMGPLPPEPPGRGRGRGRGRERG